MTAAAVTSPPGIASGPERLGDLLLGFGHARPDVVGRSGSVGWEPGAEGPGWRLGSQGPGPDWAGFPVTSLTVDGRRCWLIGELYGPLPGRLGLADLIAEVVQGRRSAADLSGHFALLALDEASRTWEAWTDRFGTIHLYHAQHGDAAALGTFCPAVARLASARRLDWSALAGFFACGFFPGDQTHFDDVRILRPASRYRFDARGRLLGAERYRSWSHRPEAARSYDDTVDQFGEAFDGVMADLVSAGRIALPISGGLDSRSTIAGLPDGGRGDSGRLWSYSYGYTPRSIETRISRQLAAARGLSFDGYTVGPYVFDRLGAILNAVEGFQDLTQCRQAAVASQIGQHADFVIAAHWGDVWLDDMGLAGQEPPPRGDAVLDHALKKIQKRGRDWLLRELVAPRLGGQAPDALNREAIGRELAGFAGIEDPDFRIKAFKTDCWSFRWTLASLRAYQLAAFPRLPFYDTRIADFFETVPSAFVAGRRLQIDYLKRRAPDLARITWPAAGANLYRHKAGPIRKFARRVRSKAWRVLTRDPVIQRNWEVQFQNPAGRRALEHHLLRPGLKLHEFVAPARVRGVLDELATQPGAANGYTVSMLLTFSAWLESHG